MMTTVPRIKQAIAKAAGKLGYVMFAPTKKKLSLHLLKSQMFLLACQPAVGSLSAIGAYQECMMT